MTFHSLTVAGVEHLTADSAAVTFAVPPRLRDAYAFKAGESLTLRRNIDGAEHRRSYSICAPVGAAPRVGVREVPGGLFSSWLVRGLAVGDTVEVQTPAGTFQADPATSGRHLCIAAGSGITPVLSIAASALAIPARRSPCSTATARPTRSCSPRSWPTSRTGTRTGSSSCTSSRVSRATSSCSPGGWTPTGSAGCLPCSSRCAASTTSGCAGRSA